YAAEEKRIYLTFDDGPSTVVTGRILDTLKEQNVKATFFVVSDRALTRKETLRRIAAEGHTIGVHSATHEYGKIYASKQSFLEDVETCAKVIRNITGVTPRVYRFPGGGYGHKDEYTPILKEMGYRVVAWNAVCGDEEIPHADADILFRTSVETAKGRNNVVLLLHDSAYRKATAEALPRIIEYFRAQNYTFCAY
nr:polysaccharide deacetylase [Clostridiales bacterium]